MISVKLSFTVQGLRTSKLALTRHLGWTCMPTILRCRMKVRKAIIVLSGRLNGKF